MMELFKNFDDRQEVKSPVYTGPQDIYGVAIRPSSLCARETDDTLLSLRL